MKKSFGSKVYDFITWIDKNTGSFDTFFYILPVFVIAGIVYWVVRSNLHKHKFADDFKQIRRKARLNELIRLVLVCWITFWICGLLFPTVFWPHFFRRLFLGLNPFEELPPIVMNRISPVPEVIRRALSGILDWYRYDFFMINHFPHWALNTALYIPVGLGVPFVYKKATFPKVVLTCASISVFTETFQIFIGRECNVDDVICNVLGGMLGYLIFMLIRKLFPKFTAKCKLSVYDAAVEVAAGVGSDTGSGAKPKSKKILRIAVPVASLIVICAVIIGVVNSNKRPPAIEAYSDMTFTDEQSPSEFWDWGSGIYSGAFEPISCTDNTHSPYKFVTGTGSLVLKYSFYAIPNTENPRKMTILLYTNAGTSWYPIDSVQVEFKTTSEVTSYSGAYTFTELPSKYEYYIRFLNDTEPIGKLNNDELGIGCNGFTVSVS